MKKGVFKLYLRQDPRINSVLTLAKIVYNKANFANHNMDYIAQMLFRQEILKYGFSERIDFLKKSLDSLNERSDFLVKIEDLV